jgi:ribosome-associated protein
MEGTKDITHTTDELLRLINDAILNKKGNDVVNIDLRSMENAVTRYFVICHANTDVQMHAIADEVLHHVKKNAGETPLSKEGMSNSNWILLDYVDVVVHIFRTEYREFYQLESLWGDAPSKRIEPNTTQL